MDKLKTLRFFASICEQGSFVETAKIFGTSPSTISKAIARLESDLEITLFTRTTRALTLTSAGKNYFSTVKQVLHDLDLTEVVLRDDFTKISGKLIINTPVSYGRLYLRPLIADFCQAYPDIDIELIYDDAYVDIIEKGIDITFRSGTLMDSQLIARKLSPIDFLVCAPKGYFSDGTVITNTLLLAQPWINFRYKQTGKLMPVMLKDSNGHYQEHLPRSLCTIDDGEALAELCADGMGLAQMPHFIARHRLLDNSIEAIFSPYSPKHYGVFAMYSKAKKTPPKITAFIDFVQQRLFAIGEDSDTTWARSPATQHSIPEKDALLHPQ
jgi:DNA-binding transcriptional LysR family regulator